MKLYLDDERPTPAGWIGCRWPEDVINLIKQGGVEEISLDNDLDEDSGYVHPRVGYDVILWLENEVVTNPNFKMPKVRLHTQNPVALQKMKAGLRYIHGILQEREHVENN
jgi:hypothetical protein